MFCLWFEHKTAFTYENMCDYRWFWRNGNNNSRLMHFECILSLSLNVFWARMLLVDNLECLCRVNGRLSRELEIIFPSTLVPNYFRKRLRFANLQITRLKSSGTIHWRALLNNKRDKHLFASCEGPLQGNFNKLSININLRSPLRLSDVLIRSSRTNKWIWGPKCLRGMRRILKDLHRQSGIRPETTKNLWLL